MEIPRSKASPQRLARYRRWANTITARRPRFSSSADWVTIFLAGLVGLGAGYGAALFTWMIHQVQDHSFNWANAFTASYPWMANAAIVLTPAVGLVVVAWLTRTFAPEAAGHGVPEVITAVARNDGIIRPQVSVIKAVASAICIGAGGSVGREGPIVQVGAALGSTGGQLFRLAPRQTKILVAAGAAAGISATFNAPLAGVMFASEIIIGTFAIQSMTPIVIASVLADVVQKQVGEFGVQPAFQQIDYSFPTSLAYMPPYFLLGLGAGVFAVSFTKLLYWIEESGERRLPDWRIRAIVLGLAVGAIGATFNWLPPVRSLDTDLRVEAADRAVEKLEESPAGRGAALVAIETPLDPLPPPLLGSGSEVIDHALHLQTSRGGVWNWDVPYVREGEGFAASKTVRVDREELWAEIRWLVPLMLLKPLMTSITLAGGGSGGVFAPSLYIGATLGAVFGLLVNLLAPAYAVDPGIYAIVGMGALVAGTTHGILSAILIVYEMTNNYLIILPIMIAAGLSSLVARYLDPESIYYKKLSRRGETLFRGHDLHRLDHVMVRDVMIRAFPRLKQNDNVSEIVRVAHEHPQMESLPVMDADGRLIGVIRPIDLHRVLESDVSPHLVNAEDIALRTPISVSPAENLFEAIRDFGAHDVELLPVETGKGENRRLIGVLLRRDVMKRYREEMLARH